MRFLKSSNVIEKKNEPQILNNTDIITSILDENFCDFGQSSEFLKSVLNEEIGIKENIMLFRIPNPSLNQKPSKIYLTVMECYKLIGISIYEYLFADNTICSPKSIFKTNGKLLFKISDVVLVITSTEIWLLNHAVNGSVRIIDKLLYTYGYNITSDISTPSTKISYCDLNACECISPYYCNNKTNFSIEYNSHHEPEASIKDISTKSSSKFNIFETTQKDIVVNRSKSNQTEFTPHIENENVNPENNDSARKSDSYSLSFAGMCIDVILETIYLDLDRSINSTKVESINCCNGFIKSSKWYKYPWRFTFNDFTKKKLISKSVSVIESNISALKESLTRLLEEMKCSQNNIEYLPIISVQELEKILNKYIPAIYKATKELREIKTSISLSDELFRIYLDFQRNEYMYTNLKISLVTLSCSVTSVITGIFGMNLLSGIEYNPIAWCSV
ncbi:hypothetical protein FG386_003535 [Cryptosporidium ryanae]|uniref:uncharacterized protein n=1 Tax=Cryptosporidium ryanae TaxID=515981 RepID=UPI00351A34C6|nr:hypothetical protein FG386_003535 [Cryptosporidium ryanae]